MLAFAPVSNLARDSQSMAPGDHIRRGQFGSRLPFQQAEPVRAQLALPDSDRDLACMETADGGGLTIRTLLTGIVRQVDTACGIESALPLGQIDQAEAVSAGDARASAAAAVHTLNPWQSGVATLPMVTEV